jgi:undecaprenyl-diphosphatase
MEFLEALDQGTWNFFQQFQAGKPILNMIMVGLGQLSSLPISTGLLALGVGYLLYRRRWWDAALLAGIFGLACLIAWGTQAIVGRQRPQVVVQPLEPIRGSPTFPCDQTLLATVVFLSLPCLAGPRGRERGLAVGAILVMLIALSRMYVGQSFVTDVFASLLMGYALALTFRELAGERESRIEDRG